MIGNLIPPCTVSKARPGNGEENNDMPNFCNHLWTHACFDGEAGDLGDEDSDGDDDAYGDEK